MRCLRGFDVVAVTRVKGEWSCGGEVFFVSWQVMYSVAHLRRVDPQHLNGSLMKTGRRV